MVDDLDSLPLPRFDLLGDIGRIKHNLMRASTNRTIILISSRGCPYHCRFCNRLPWGSNYRAHSVERMLKEVDCFDDVSQVVFQDDNFLVDRERTISFCKEKIKRGLDWTWTCSARVDNVDEEVAEWFGKSGCELIFFGIERGDQQEWDYVNKQIDIDKIKNAVSLCNANGIKPYGSFIIGTPGESVEKMKNIQRLVKEVKFGSVSVHVYIPYPLTLMRADAEKSGRLIKDWSLYSTHSDRRPYVPEGFTEGELGKWQNKIYWSFYLTPRWMLKNFRKLLKWSFIKKAPKIIMDKLIGK